MTLQTYRSIGALIGLAIGIGVMLTLGIRGIIPSAIFGAGGCVAGGVTAEQIYRWNHDRGG